MQSLQKHKQFRKWLNTDLLWWWHLDCMVWQHQDIGQRGGYEEVMFGQIRFWTFRSYNKWKLNWDASKWHLACSPAAIPLFSESWICWLFVLGLWELRLTVRYPANTWNAGAMVAKHQVGPKEGIYASCARHGIERATVSIKKHLEEMRCYFFLTLVFWMILGKSPCLHV